MKHKLIKKLADEILKTSLRGKPNDLNPDIGMDEAEQKMYDGKERSRGSYDQLEIIKKKRDWIDDETLLIENYMDERAYKKARGFFYDDNWEDYYANPKGTGEGISPAVLSPDEHLIDEILKDKGIITRYYIKDRPYIRDETQKYLTPEQILFRDNYWKEKYLK